MFKPKQMPWVDLHRMEGSDAPSSFTSFNASTLIGGEIYE